MLQLLNIAHMQKQFRIEKNINSIHFLNKNVLSLLFYLQPSNLNLNSNVFLQGNNKFKNKITILTN